MEPRFARIALAAAALLFFAAPASAQADGDGDSWSGPASHVEQARQAVLRSDAEWQRLWLEDIGRLPPGPLPADSMAVAVFLGTRPSGGYRVDIPSWSQEDRYLQVEYRETGPGPSDMVIMMMTTPYAVRLVPFSKQEVIFTGVQ
jgi:hypothetical protein